MQKTMNKKKIKESRQEVITVKPLELSVAAFKVRGTAPYVQNKFSKKAREQLEATAQSGKKKSSSASNRAEARDFEQEFLEATHFLEDGSCGIPASGLRAAMISACRVAGYQMTKTKLAVFIEHDGFDSDDFTPLVKITKGKPVLFKSAISNRGSAAICIRPRWATGWEAIIRVKYDSTFFQLDDIANLLQRCGTQVGIGCGRPDSAESAGMGWGTFEIVGD